MKDIHKTIINWSKNTTGNIRTVHEMVTPMKPAIKMQISIDRANSIELARTDPTTRTSLGKTALHVKPLIDRRIVIEELVQFEK